jgi:NAD(P)-dependent dehydrogenase (short-subunit alcohol dehydrogenase family)
MSEFQDQVIVITGGNSGIGAAVAQHFADHGAKVVIFGRNAETLESVRDRLGGDTLAVQGDVTELGDLDRLFAETKSRFGRIDHLVVNAGIARTVAFHKVEPALFDQIMDINVRGAFFTAQKALPLLRDGGTITLVSSIVNGMGIPGSSVYGASKAAVRSLARTLAAELAPRGIRVYSLSPGPIETPIFDTMGLPQENVEEMLEGFVSHVPLRRMGKPEETAAVVAFLASEAAAYMTGADIPVDGGMAQV